MATYSIYLPPAGAARNSNEEFRLLHDGKSLLALIAPVIWLIWHRLWMPLMVYLVIVSTIFTAMSMTNDPVFVLLSFLPGLYLFLEGKELLRGKLERDGWRYMNVVEALNCEEAEMRYLYSDAPYRDKVARSIRPPIGSSIVPRPSAAPIVTGIFSE